MAWRITKVEDQREYLVKSYISKLSSMSDLCKECGVSRKTGYKWYQRYLQGGMLALADASRALYKEGVELITKLKKNMKNKLMSLWDKLLLRKRGLVESVHNRLKRCS